MPNPKVRTLTIGGVTYDLQDNISGYITGITSSDVTTALGFTPYNATNPNGYTSNTGTITSVKTTAGAHTTINVSSGAANFNVPTKTSHLTNDSGFLTSYTETDPTVPSWAKESSKPSYNFSEIGSTPTTLSGYGITNAYTKTEVDGLVSGVLHYKGTKANYAALPSSGNTTGDVWHLTNTGAEWAWDGSVWQELGTAVDLSNYVTTDDSRLSDARTPTAHNQALSTITDADDLKAIEALSGTSGLLKKTAANTWALDTNTYLTSYTETDPVFSASAAAGITSTDISNWNAKVSDDHKWNDVSLTKSATSITSDVYVPCMLSTSATSAELLSVLDGATTAYSLVRRNGSGYVKAATPPANDNSTYVATTAWVKSALPTKVSDLTNDSGFITSYTDEKVKIVQVNDSNSHYLIFGNYSTTATTQLYDADLEYITTLSNNQNGYGRINLGNSKAQGTDGAKYGAIRFYGTTTYGVEIQGGAPTAWRAITLPDKNGTIALTSDIPTVYSSTNTGGYLTMATLPIYDGTVE